MKSASKRPHTPERDILADYFEAYDHLRAKGKVDHIVKCGHYAFHILSGHKNSGSTLFEGVKLDFVPSHPADSFSFHRRRK